MCKLTCPIEALMLVRGRMTNQERMDNPMSREDAVRFALESNDRLWVFAGLNRLMDIAYDLRKTDQKHSRGIWKEVGTYLEELAARDPSLLGYRTLLRYADKSTNPMLAAWARVEAAKRDPDQPMLADAA